MADLLDGTVNAASIVGIRVVGMVGATGFAGMGAAGFAVMVGAAAFARMPGVAWFAGMVGVAGGTEWFCCSSLSSLENTSV